MEEDNTVSGIAVTQSGLIPSHILNAITETRNDVLMESNYNILDKAMKLIDKQLDAFDKQITAGEELGAGDKRFLLDAVKASVALAKETREAMEIDDALKNISHEDMKKLGNFAGNLVNSGLKKLVVPDEK